MAAMPHPFTSQITFCRVNDLDAISTFYETILHLPLVLDQGGCRIFRAAPHAYLGFCRRDDAPSPDGVVLTLVVDDVDGWHAHLVEHGVAIEKPPTLNPDYNIYHIFFRDPAGYLLEIQRFEDPRWADE
jgi:catechol 2,3-dioxygenase-like lactoylglutathione lyase family enzyme